MQRLWCPLAVHIVPADRLAWGDWNTGAACGEGAGDIHSSYSADLIEQQAKVRHPFLFQKSLWVTVNLNGSDEIERADAYRLILASQFDGTPTTFKVKTIIDEKAPHIPLGDPLGLYHGISVTFRDEAFVLCGPPALFVAAPERPFPLAQLPALCWQTG